MKLTLSSILAAAAASNLTLAQTSAYSTPVGYVTVTVPAQSDTTIVPALERAPLHAAASSSISGNTVGAAGLTPGAFVSPETYLQVTSGPLSGQRFPITANDGTSITVSSSATLQSAGFVTGNTFKVVPFWTLNTMFPSGAGVGTTSDVSNPTSFVLESGAGAGINKSSTKLYFYCTGDAVNGFDPGWYDNDDLFSGPLPETRLDLARMYSIRTSNPSAQSVVIAGQVPDSSLVIPVAVNTAFNDVLTGSPFPIDVSLQESGLQSAIQATTDVSNPVELLFIFNDNATGINKSAAKVYFYCSGDTVNGFDPGWYDNDDLFAGSVPDTEKVIKAGRGFIIRKAPYVSSGTIPWVATRPYGL